MAKVQFLGPARHLQGKPTPQKVNKAAARARKKAERRRKK